MIPFNRIRHAIVKAEGKEELLGVKLSEAAVRQARSIPALEPLWEEIRTMADKARREPIPALPFSAFHLFASQGTRLEYERPYFERRGRLLALALEAWADPELSPTTLEDVVWAICDEYSWALPAHISPSLEQATGGHRPPEQVVDLFAAETAHGLAETLYLLGGRLNEWVVYRVRTEIERRVFRPLFDSATPFHWEASTHNWSAVCGGAAGMAALLLEEDRERLAGMVDRVQRALGSFLEGYGEDGCCLEGFGYWSYGFGYYVYFAEMLRAFTKGEADLLAGDKLRRIAAFPAAVALSPPGYVSFSDSGDTYRPNPGLLSRLHQRFGQPLPAMSEAPSMARELYRFAHTVRNLLWTDPALLGGETAVGDFVFPDASWLVSKRRLPDGLLAFAAKGGHNDEPHNHNDLGHFIVHLCGETLFTDLGAGVYTRDYFGPGRYTYLHNGSDGHSVPLVNGQQQKAGRERAAQVMRLDEGESSLVYELELSAAYPQEAAIRSLRRTFVWEPAAARGEAALTLTDTFSFSGGDNRVEERWISLYKPSIETGKMIWRGSRGEAILTWDDAAAEVRLDTIDTRDHHDQPLTVYRARLLLTSVPAEASYSFRMACRAL